MDTPLRWIITALFVVNIVVYAYFLVSQYRRRSAALSHVIHLAMSVAMILMAWDIGANALTLGAVIVLLVAGGWFLLAAGRDVREANYYYAATTVAMAWMYVAMNDALMGQIGKSTDHTMSMPMPMSMPSDLDMAGMPMPTHMSHPAPGSAWIVISAVNWLAALGFAVAAIYWPCHWFAHRRTSPTPSTSRVAALEMGGQACAAAGMALMFAVLL